MSDDGRQDAPGATDAATEAREAIDLDAIEAQARHWDHLIRDDPATTLTLVRELREARAEVERWKRVATRQPIPRRARG